MRAPAGLWRGSDAFPGIADSVRQRPSRSATAALVDNSGRAPDCYTDKGNICSIFIRRRDAPRRVAGGAQHAASGSLYWHPRHNEHAERVTTTSGRRRTRCCTNTDIAFGQRTDGDMLQPTIIFTLKQSEQVTKPKGSHDSFAEMTDEVSIFLVLRG